MNILVKKLGLFSATVILASVSLSSLRAEETTGEKIEDTGRTIKRKTKKGMNHAKDEVCEMVNGRMECIGKKIKHKTGEAVDSVKDGAKSTKDKVD
jgi:hypothetical protein